MIVTNILIGIAIVHLHYIHLALIDIRKETHHNRLETQTIRHYVEKMDDSP